MLIRCKLREIDNVEYVGATKYHFKKDAAGNLVCDVQDDEAARHFLAKTDIYEPFDEEAALAAQAAALKADVEDDDDEEGDGFFNENTGALPGLEPKPDTAPEAPAEAPAVIPEPGPYENMTHEELAALYKERFGKAAHPAAKYETLLARLIESDQTAPSQE